MMAINHTVTGALIALSVKQPAAALPLALASHFAMDLLPHYGLRGLDNLTKAYLSQKTYKVIINVDTALAGLSLILLPFILRHSLNPLLCFTCMFLAVGPDLIWLVRFFIYKLSGDIPKVDKFSLFHKKIQWAELKLGLIVDIAWLMSASVLISIKA